MGVHRFIRCRGLPQKDHCNGLLAKIVGHQKIYGCKHSYRHHGDVHSHHTLCGLFFTAGYRYTGPYDVPLLRVLNQSHVSSTSPMCWALYTPWKAQKHQLRFKKLQGALPGQFFQLLKKKKTRLNSLKKTTFSSGVKKTWAQATIWTLWFQFTQGDRHSINPCKDLGSIQVVQLDGRNGWLGLHLKKGKQNTGRAFKALEKLAIYRCFWLAHDMYVCPYIYIYIYLDKNLKDTYKFI